MSLGIYLIKNNINNRGYVGKSKNLEERRKQHFYLLQKGSHENKQMQEDYNNMGEKAFSFEVLENVEDERKLDYLEDYYITTLDTLNNGYNACRGNIRSVINEDKLRTPTFKEEIVIPEDFPLQDYLRDYIKIFNKDNSNIKDIFNSIKSIHCFPDTSFWIKDKKDNKILLQTDDVADYLTEYEIYTDRWKISDQVYYNLDNSLYENYAAWEKYVEERNKSYLKENALDTNDKIREKILNNFADCLLTLWKTNANDYATLLDYEIQYYVASIFECTIDDLPQMRYRGTCFENCKPTI